MEIGAQLFTVREHCQTVEGLESTLRRVAEIGYRYVQISGVCEYDPVWMKKLLDELGLSCVLTHTRLDKMKEDPDRLISNHNVLNCRCVGLGSYDFVNKTPENFAEDVAPVAKALAAGGKYFMFHNHAVEFTKDAEGVPYLARVAEYLPPSEVGFTFDTYWASKAGEDPASWLRRLSGRVPCIHLKDITDDEKMAVVGEGNIDFDAVFDAAEAAGVEYMLVEQDDCYGEDPFACLERSYRYLKAKGF